MVEKERARYDTLLPAVLSRGLKDEKEAAPQPEPDKPLPAAIAQALSHWPEGSAPYLANLQYALDDSTRHSDDKATEKFQELIKGVKELQPYNVARPPGKR